MRKLDYPKLVVDIQNWIANYLKSASAKGVVLGISGGIDSAVVATLCTRALGRDNVIGLMLPIDSIPEDLKDGKMIAENLNIRFYVCDLTFAYREILKALPQNFEENKLAKANIKPRLRMIMNYYIGQSLGKFLVVGTGNRTELAIGYFTKYGDGGVDFEPIGGLYKCEVRKIAKVLGVSEKIIKKPPSAGLWLGQTDEDEIGLKYDTIDEILYRIDYDLDFDGCESKDIYKVKNMITSSQHKNQMPPFYKIK
jgi:NAD+ synthase